METISATLDFHVADLLHFPQAQQMRLPGGQRGNHGDTLDKSICSKS